MKYAILGAGAIGTALVRRFTASGINVNIANSKDPETLKSLVEALGPLVTPVPATEALQADVVILALPFEHVPDALQGIQWNNRIVIDATNAVNLPAFTPRDLEGRLSTHVIAEALPGARVVKAFNTLAAAHLAEEPTQLGGRRTLFVSSDDAPARHEVAKLIEQLGFAAVDLGEIEQGGRAQQFGGGLAAKNFIQLD